MQFGLLLETGNAQLKTYLRGPGEVLRSKSPDMVRQQIHGCLLTHYAKSALICRAATEAGIDPDRVRFKRTVHIVRRQAVGPAAFPPEQQERTLASVVADITRNKNLNPQRRHRSYRGWLSEPATTPIASNDPATTAPATPAPPRSAWSATASSHSQH